MRRKKINLNHCDPLDFIGVPVAQEDSKVRLIPPAWAEQLVANGKEVLVFDENIPVSPTMQAAIRRVILERKVGSLPLPPEVRTVIISRRRQGG